MPMVVVCLSCRSKLTVPDGSGGKQVKCPVCGTEMTISAAVRPAAVPRAADPPPVERVARVRRPTPETEAPAEVETPAAERVSRTRRPKQPRSRSATRRRRGRQSSAVKWAATAFGLLAVVGCVVLFLVLRKVNPTVASALLPPPPPPPGYRAVVEPGGGFSVNLPGEQVVQTKFTIGNVTSDNHKGQYKWEAHRQAAPSVRVNVLSDPLPPEFTPDTSLAGLSDLYHRRRENYAIWGVEPGAKERPATLAGKPALEVRATSRLGGGVVGYLTVVDHRVYFLELWRHDGPPDEETVRAVTGSFRFLGTAARVPVTGTAPPGFTAARSKTGRYAVFLPGECGMEWFAQDPKKASHRWEAVPGTDLTAEADYSVHGPGTRLPEEEAAALAFLKQSYFRGPIPAWVQSEAVHRIDNRWVAEFRGSEVSRFGFPANHRLTFRVLLLVSDGSKLVAVNLTQRESAPNDAVVRTVIDSLRLE